MCMLCMIREFKYVCVREVRLPSGFSCYDNMRSSVERSKVTVMICLFKRVKEEWPLTPAHMALFAWLGLMLTGALCQKWWISSQHTGHLYPGPQRALRSQETLHLPHLSLMSIKLINTQTNGKSISLLLKFCDLFSLLLLKLPPLGGLNINWDWLMLWWLCKQDWEIGLLSCIPEAEPLNDCISASRHLFKTLLCGNVCKPSS